MNKITRRKEDGSIVSYTIDKDGVVSDLSIKKDYDAIKANIVEYDRLLKEEIELGLKRSDEGGALMFVPDELGNYLTRVLGSFMSNVDKWEKHLKNNAFYRGFLTNYGKRVDGWEKHLTDINGLDNG